MKKAWVLSYPLSAQGSLWSDWAIPCWICHVAAHLVWVWTVCKGSFYGTIGDECFLVNEPSHEIMVLFDCSLIPQTRMRSHSVELDVWLFAGPFVYFHTLWVRTAKALARVRGCAGSPKPSLDAYLTIISWAGSNILMHIHAENDTLKILLLKIAWN